MATKNEVTPPSVSEDKTTEEMVLQHAPRPILLADQGSSESASFGSEGAHHCESCGGEWTHAEDCPEILAVIASAQRSSEALPFCGLPVWDSPREVACRHPRGHYGPCDHRSNEAKASPARWAALTDQERLRLAAPYRKSVGLILSLANGGTHSLSLERDLAMLFACEVYEAPRTDKALPACLATTEGGCEARRKMGVARGALEEVRQELSDFGSAGSGAFVELLETVTDALDKSAQPQPCPTDEHLKTLRGALQELENYRDDCESYEAPEGVDHLENTIKRLTSLIGMSLIGMCSDSATKMREGKCPPDAQCLACDRLGYHLEPKLSDVARAIESPGAIPDLAADAVAAIQGRPPQTAWTTDDKQAREWADETGCDVMLIHESGEFKAWVSPSLAKRPQT